MCIVHSEQINPPNLTNLPHQQVFMNSKICVSTMNKNSDRNVPLVCLQKEQARSSHYLQRHERDEALTILIEFTEFSNSKGGRSRTSEEEEKHFRTQF